MWSRLVFGFVIVLQATSVSPLTNDKTQVTVTNGDAVPCSCKVYDRKSDLLRQLLNQETVIRMALEKKVCNIVKDVEKFKQQMESNNENLREEIISLKYRNQRLNISTRRQQKETKGDIVALRKRTEKSETETNKQLQDTKGDISVLQKEIQSFKANFKHQSNITNILSDGLNTSIDAIKADLEQAKTTQLKLLSAVSTLQVFQTNFLLTKYDGLNTTIVAIKADLEQAKKTQLKLSSAESTLEVLRQNISLLTKYVTQARVGFTAAVTSRSSSWSGDVLVFPNIVTNTGNSYSTSTGKFTAPRTGTYVFFVTAVSYHNNGLYLGIVHNGADKVRTMSYQSYFYQTGTNLAVLELSQGDTVWVRRSGGRGYHTESVPFTTFSGFLL